MSCTIVHQAAFFRGRHLFADHLRLAERYLGRLDNLWGELTSKVRARKLNRVRCKHIDQGLAGQILFIVRAIFFFDRVKEQSAFSKDYSLTYMQNNTLYLFLLLIDQLKSLTSILNDQLMSVLLSF